MQKTLLGTAIALTVSVLALPVSAADGTITINGKLTQQTCTVKINNGTADAVISLPTLSTSALDAAKKVAGRTAFTMNLTGCTPASGSVRAYFEHGPTVDAASGRLNNMQTTDAAKNVQIQLRDNDENDVYVGNTSQRTNPATDVSAAGTADLLYSAYYYATAPAEAGGLATSVTYSIDYQ
ncbi:fimbrial protein [Mixta theicola]|uniref:Fimbrial protein n=1 Tax=Mixta theicola TaxID=1458355 RepID=A0A2K1Q8E8_9GAMM|nr:fimbrial protein [Mixta theicola]PNS11304.1 fimbrial protein [Mixta theicola]